VGNIAPDSGTPNDDWTEFDPPPHITHFHPPGADHASIEDLRFFRQYLSPLPADVSSSSILWGYFFHLIIDRFWVLTIAKPSRRRFQREFDTDLQYLSEAKRDWYGLDFDYVRANPTCLFWTVLAHATFDADPLPFLPDGALSQNIHYIQTFYQRDDDEITNQYIVRPNRLLQKQEMDTFVDSAFNLLLRVHSRLTGSAPEAATANSIFELEEFASPDAWYRGA
jgi:hypothetical protein